MALFDFPPERPKGLLGFIPEVEAQVPADRGAWPRLIHRS